MDNETFKIICKPYNCGGVKYRMTIEIIHRSEQVIRFPITGGNKIMIMEKLLMKHRGQWKIKETNFKLSGSAKETAMTVMEIQDKIEYYLAERPIPVNKYKNKQ